MENKKLEITFTIGHLSKQTGCNIETIRYYEKIKLLPKTNRSQGNYRLYNAFHSRRLNFILRARSLGFNLEQIRTLLGLTESGTNRLCSEVRLMGINHIKEIEKKIKDLKSLKTFVERIVVTCKDDIDACPLIEELFQP